VKPGNTAAPLCGVAVLSADCTTLTIGLRGDLDLAAESMLRCLAEGAAASGATRVRFELSDVVFCDARGLRLLAHTAAQMAARGIAVCITRPSVAVTRTARIGLVTYRPR
jgi:anti-anti-sigma factor